MIHSFHLSNHILNFQLLPAIIIALQTKTMKFKIIIWNISNVFLTKSIDISNSLLVQVTIAVKKKILS
jgi:hypothetical protein